MNAIKIYDNQDFKDKSWSSALFATFTMCGLIFEISGGAGSDQGKSCRGYLVRISSKHQHLKHGVADIYTFKGQPLYEMINKVQIEYRSHGVTEKITSKERDDISNLCIQYLFKDLSSLSILVSELVTNSFEAGKRQGRESLQRDLCGLLGVIPISY